MKALAGPKTHICWTPDSVPKEKRQIVVLVLEEDRQRYLRLQGAVEEIMAAHRIGSQSVSRYVVDLLLEAMK